MSSNSIAISRELLAAGVEEKTASAVAEAIVKHSDDRNATKVEILELEANLKDEINAMRNQLSKLEGKVDSLEAKLDSSRDETRSNIRLLTVIVVIGILVPYIERAFGG